MVTSVYYNEISELVRDIDVDLMSSFDDEFNMLIAKFKHKKAEMKMSAKDKLERFKSYFGVWKNDGMSSDELIEEIDSMTNDNDDELLKQLSIND